MSGRHAETAIYLLQYMVRMSSTTWIGGMNYIFRPYRVSTRVGTNTPPTELNCASHVSQVWRAASTAGFTIYSLLKYLNLLI